MTSKRCSRAPSRCSRASRRCCRRRRRDPDWKTRSPLRAGASAAGAATCSRCAHPHAIALVRPASHRRAEAARSTSNTRQFVAGLPGEQRAADRRARHRQVVAGQGAARASTRGKGLRLIEVDKADLVDLPDIVDRSSARPERFVVFCDDLTFDEGEPGYKALKVMLDGSIAGAVDERADLRDVEPAPPAARVLGREPRDEARRRGGASGRIGRGEDLAVRALRAVGLVLSVRAGRLPRGGRRAGSRTSASRRRAARDADERTREALQWALQRGSRSGRVAWQFARDWAGARHAALQAQRDSVRVSDRVVRVAAAVILRADGARPARAASAGQGVRRLLGISRRQARAGRDAARTRSRASCTRSSASSCARASPWLVQEFVYPHAHVELNFFRVLRVRRRAREARRAGVRVAGSACDRPSRRCCPRTRACWRR